MLVRTILLKLILFFVLAGTLAHASDLDVDPPKYEHRSVWVATAHSLDFPKIFGEDALRADIPERKEIADWPESSTQSAEDQKEDLIEIIDYSHQQGLNAVIFQVVPRGDAFYESERIPWSHHLSGTPGEHPGWDPLEVAVEEAHKRGMELHAWYNVGRVGDQTQPLPDSEPYHVYQEHEEWVHNIDGSFWLDPGFPDARDWMTENVMEIVENYDVDAIHFDFIRYNTNGYDTDSETMEQYNVNDIDNINDWRRDNLSEFLRDVYPAVKEEKPWVKVGSTPVGHYTNVPEFTWGALWGFDSVFQDSRGWLEEEINDYIVPQIYWDIGNETNPRFDIILNDWANDMRGRHVYIGKGPYQQFIDRDEINAQIDSTRKSAVHGSVYFRYDNIHTIIGRPILEDRYSLNASIIPPMEWMDTDVPEAPELSIDDPIARQNPSGGDLQDEEQIVHLSWNDQDFETEEGDDLIRYAVYRYNGDVEPDKEDVQEDAMNLIGITGETSYTDVAPPAAHDNFYYYVSALNRNNNESGLSNSAATEVLVSSDDEPELASDHRLHQNYPNPFNPVTEISYELASDAQVELTVYDLAGRKITTLREGTESAGTHTATFDASSLASGVYMYRLMVSDDATGSLLHSETRRMTLVK